MKNVFFCEKGKGVLKRKIKKLFFCRFLSRKATLNRLFLISVSVISIYAILICKISNSQNSPPMI